MATIPIPVPSDETPVAQPPAVTTPVVEAPHAVTPGDQQRQELYNRLYATEPVQIQQPVEPPVVTSTETSSAAPAVPETSELQALRSELATLRTELQSVRVPATPQAPPVAPPPEAGWLDLLKEGKIKEAEDYLIRRVQTAVAQQTTPQITQEALEVFEARREITDFLNTLRSQNADLLPLERYLSGPVEQRIAAIRAEGKIKTPSDFSREYKAALSAEVEELRKVTQKLVGSGKQQAMTIQKEVISSSVLPPQQVETNRETPKDTNQGESTEDYFARRKADTAKARRMVVS